MRWNPDVFIPDVIHEQAICRPPSREVGWEKSYAFVPHRCHGCRDAVWLETWRRFWVVGKTRWTVVKGLCTRCYVVEKLEKKPEPEPTLSVTMTNITSAASSGTFTVGLSNVAACTSYNMFWEDA